MSASSAPSSRSSQFAQTASRWAILGAGATLLLVVAVGLVHRGHSLQSLSLASRAGGTAGDRGAVAESRGAGEAGLGGHAPPVADWPRSVAPREEEPPDTADMLSRSIERLDELSALTAKLRCYGRLMNVNLELSGSYWQLNRAGRSQIRYELSTDDAVARHPPTIRMLQVCDGRFLWELIERRGGPRTVGRTDLRQLQQQTPDDKLQVLRLGAGGVPKMLESLRRDFDFSRATATTLDDISTWEIVGRWKEGRREALERISADLTEDWPMFLPTHVHLMFGKDDLFPYRIDFRRLGQPLLVCEFYEVAVGAFLDEELFRWRTAEPQIDDHTDRLRDQLQAVDSAP